MLVFRLISKRSNPRACTISMSPSTIRNTITCRTTCAVNQKLGKRKRRRLAARVRPRTLRHSDQRPYFHGGNAGLEVGGYILPPSETGAPQNGNVPSHTRGRSHIYMVRDFIEAAPWAAHHPNPIIYEVKPEGTVENDPDVEEPGLSYRCPKARIVAVHRIPDSLLVAAQLELLRK
jgi:hypothetical protein